MKVCSKRQQKTKPRNDYLIKPRVMTRGSEVKTNTRSSKLTLTKSSSCADREFLSLYPYHFTYKNYL